MTHTPLTLFLLTLGPLTWPELFLVIAFIAVALRKKRPRKHKDTAEEQDWRSAQYRKEIEAMPTHSPNNRIEKIEILPKWKYLCGIYLANDRLGKRKRVAGNKPADAMREAEKVLRKWAEIENTLP